MTSESSLSSLASSLDELLRRVRSMADEAGPDDDLGAELVEVERQLQAVSRRLAKVSRRRRRRPG
jgi:hypothetical protein